MFGVNWSDPQALWLNITNLALGVVTLAAVLIVAGAVGWELVFKHRRARQTADLDAKLSSILGAASPHLLHVPGLGLTMADGGTPVRPEAESSQSKATRK